MELAFFLSLALSAFSYFVYPAILTLLPARRRLGSIAASQSGHSESDSQVDSQGIEPTLPPLSLIITAHNEGKRIAAKLANALATDYPKDRLDIIVASDASTDDTDTIVKRFADRGVRLIRPDERKGKEYAQWCAIQAATGEILVFSDVATETPADALRKIAAAFESAPAIGAVSSEDRFISQDGRLVGEGAYVRYEMWLRRLESERGGLVGLSGSFFAARSRICRDWDIHSPSDFNTALNAARQNHVAISHPEVIGMYADIKDPAAEYQRKVRTIIRGITALARHPEVLSPHYGLFAFQVWGHKLLRWLVPWFLIATLLTNLAIVDRHPFYELTLAAQIFFYATALAAHWVPAFRATFLGRLVYYFVQANVAVADATIKFLTGTRMTVWTPSAR